MGKLVIISLDGGGIRGILQASFLACMDEDLKSIYDHFDCFSGTSVGSIIAGLLASKKISGKQILECFNTENLKQMFNKSAWGFAWLFKGTRYKGKSKTACLHKIFGDQRFLDLDKLTIIPAYDFIQNRVKVFKSSGGKDTSSNPYLGDVVDASSAAVTFFPPIKIASDWLIDGAMSALSPTMICVSAGLRQGYRLEDIYVLSIGCGSYHPNLSPTEKDKIGRSSQKWGAITWIKNGLVDEFGLGPMSVVDYQCRLILEDRYLRINRSGSYGDIDDITPQNLVKLCAAGKDWYAHFKTDLLNWLKVSKK